MAEDKEIKLKFTIDTADSAKSVSDVRKAIKDLTSEVIAAGENGGEGIDQLNQKIGELKEKLKDAAEVTNAYRGNSIERLTNSVGLLKEGFATFNFDKIKAGFKVLGSAISFSTIAITGIITAITYLVTHFEDLRKAFKPLDELVTKITNGFYALTDAIGITNHAADVYATDELARTKKLRDAKDKDYQDDLALQKAKGKTDDELFAKSRQYFLERDRQDKAELANLRNKATAGAELSKDELARIDELKERLRQSDVEKAKLTTDDTKRAEKNAADKLKIETEAAAKAKKIRDDNTELDKKRKTDALLNSKELEDKRYDILTKGTDQEFEYKRDKDKEALQNIYAKSQKTKEDYQNLIDGIKGIDENYDKDKLVRDKKRNEDEEALKKNALDKSLQQNIDEAQLRVLNNTNDLAAQKALLDAQMAQELSNTELTETQKAIIKEKYRQQELALEKQSQDQKLQIFNDYTNAVSNLTDAIFNIESIGREKNSAEALKAAKKQFQINKALQFTQTLVNGASAAVAAIKDSGFLTPLGIANFAFATSVTVASLAKIAASQFNAGSTSGGGNISTPSGGGSQPSNTPTTNTFTPASLQKIGGSGQTGFNNPNLPNSKDSSEKKEPQKIYVVSQDISQSQDKDAVLERRASFSR